MNKLYAIIIMLYCWCQSLSQEYVGLQQYHTPETLDNRQPLIHNLSTPRLSYPQILRKLLLPYHHQLPYCAQIPSIYYYNSSVPQDLPPSRRYLLFYYNSLYHQNLLPYQSQEYLLAHQQKPPSEYLLFFYHNKFYHENSHISEADMYSLYDTIDNFGNGLQEDNISRWKTTPIIHHEDWTNSKMPAPTCKYIAGYQKSNFSQITTFPIFTSKNKETGIQPKTGRGTLLAYTLLNRLVKPVTRREQELTFNLLNRLVRVVRNGSRWQMLQNQTCDAYNYEWLLVIKALKHTLTELKNLSSNGLLNSLMSQKMSLGQRLFLKNVGCSHNILKNLTVLDWQGLYRKYLKSHLRTLYCHYSSKSVNSTHSAVSSFTPYGHKTTSNVNGISPVKVYSQMKYFERADRTLNSQNEPGCSKKHFNSQTQIHFK